MIVARNFVFIAFAFCICLGGDHFQARVITGACNSLELCALRLFLETLTSLPLQWKTSSKEVGRRALCVGAGLQRGNSRLMT